jgi:hypothetical protein
VPTNNAFAFVSFVSVTATAGVDAVVVCVATCDEAIEYGDV